jgi:hypothetical protein
VRPVALLVLVAACGFNPSSGDGDGDVIDAAVDAMPDACVMVPETCDGTDQDCDGVVDNGFVIGEPCDGPDLDNCSDDVTVCNAQGGVSCGNTSGDDNMEICNGINDDCDSFTDEGLGVGTPCDGEDADMCADGVFSCTDTGQVCSDDANSIVETCNGIDDDCNGVIDNGFDLLGDVNNCGECGNTCTNSMGSTACVGGNCMPTCNAGTANCNGDPDDGCELQNTNPTCNGLAVSEYTVDGDAPDTEVITGTTERVFRVRIRESDATTAIDITARVALTNGAGVDYDLYVYCPSCLAAPMNETDETLEVGRADATGDRSFDIWVDVRLDGATTTCAPWTVTITGNVNTANRCGAPL